MDKTRAKQLYGALCARCEKCIWNYGRGLGRVICAMPRCVVTLEGGASVADELARLHGFLKDKERRVIACGQTDAEIKH